MFRKLYESSRGSQRSKRSERKEINDVLKAAKKEENDREETVIICKKKDQLIYKISLITMVHLNVWNVVSSNHIENQAKVSQLYNEVDLKSELLGTTAGKFSRHLTRGAKRYLCMEKKMCY